MGCGKSTLGRELAAGLDLLFVDLDKYIEKKYFRTISKIFTDEGEERFREKERICLLEVSAFEDVVVAAGGGAPCFFDNIDVMNRTGCCVFLDVADEVLVTRLLQSKSERPLIQGKSVDELTWAIQKMMKERRKFYEKARYTVHGENISCGDVIAKIGMNCG